MYHDKIGNGGEFVKKVIAFSIMIAMILSMQTIALAENSVIFSENYNDPNYALDWELVNGKSYKVMTSRYFPDMFYMSEYPAKAGGTVDSRCLTFSMNTKNMKFFTESSGSADTNNVRLQKSLGGAVNYAKDGAAAQAGNAVVYKWQIMFSAFDSMQFTLCGYKGNQRFAVFEPDGTLKSQDGAVGTWEPNIWYNIAAVYVCGSGKYDLYINGDLAAEQVTTADANSTTDDRLYCQATVSANTDYDSIVPCNVYLDNISVELYGTSDDVVIQKPSVNAEYVSGTNIFYKMNEVKTAADLRDRLSATLSADSTLIIKDEQDRPVGDEEKISKVDGLWEVTKSGVYAFKVIPHLTLVNSNLDKGDGNVEFTASLRNNSRSYETAVLLLAMYDSSGAMIAVTAAECSAPPGAEVPVSITQSLLENCDKTDVWLIKGFDSIEAYSKVIQY